MKLLVTRHGETLWNKEDRLQGQTDTELSSEGVAQAKRLAKRLKDYAIEVIYSSPLKRALDTAKEIQRFHPKAKIILDSDLMEIHFGLFEGEMRSELSKKYPFHVKERKNDKLHYKGHGGENWLEVEERSIRALNKVLKNNKNGIIVTHGVVISFLLKKLTNLSYEEVSKQRITNTSLSVFEINGKCITVEKINSTEHLD